MKVRGRDLRQQLFSEETSTLVVNAHGGLIALVAMLCMGERLSLMNKITNEQQEAIVVFLGPTKDGKCEVGFEFEKAAGQFWGVAFPPADWTPSNLAAPEP